MSHGCVYGAEVFQAAACSREEMCCEDYATTAFGLRKPHKTLFAGAFLYTQIPALGPIAFNTPRPLLNIQHLEICYGGINSRMIACEHKTFNIYLKINTLISLHHL